MPTPGFAEAGRTSSPPASASYNPRDKDSKPGLSSSNNNDIPARSNENIVLHAHRQSHNSSKLPAFRFADRMSKKDGLVNPSLLQHIPPSPVSPPNPAPSGTTPTGPENQVDSSRPDLHKRSQRIHASQQNSIHKNNSPAENRVEPDEAKSCERKSPQSSPSRNRAATFQPPTIPAPLDAITPRRPVSLPDSPTAAVTARADATASQSSPPTSPPTKIQHRRAAGSDTSRPPPSLNSRRLQAIDTAQEAQEADISTKEWAQGQRELLLPKSIESGKSDEKRKSRPPVSFKPASLANISGNRAVIPPIRSFRSSGSRKSLGLDMHARRVSDDSSYGEDITDPNVRDRTLRALEGRGEDDYSHMTPPDSADATPDHDNTADLFMRIAHEDPTRRDHADNGMTEVQSTTSRIARASHRRPLSVAVPPSQTTSPPQVSRRLSDQRETSRTRGAAGEQSPQQLTRELNYKAISRDRTRPALPSAENPSVRSPLRPSPITPRQISFQEDALQGLSAYSRRRGSLTDSNSGVLPPRSSQYRNTNLAYAQGRTYNSSPLVPKAADTPRHEAHHAGETTHGIEGTESSASTAAPSTVWDELDDLKSRIHRLELTGKAPASSAAAMSRVSDDRPPTATTNATTMSASPKRTSGNNNNNNNNSNNATPADASSTTSSHRDSQLILLSALSKTKSIIGAEAFSAIESAANDALALSSMMGAAGQPGPISSGASTIGVGGSVTDRQLRRKAESICRSLTELCLALAEETAQPVQPSQPVQPKAQQSAPPTPQKELATSPVATRFPNLAAQRRGSALPEQALVRANTSPRTPTTLEQRRFSMMNTAALPSPRYALAAPASADATNVGRKSSLLISRTRRAGTEEPEETQTGRKSSLLRTRRAGTEEPEDAREGRKTSFLLRSRKNTNGDDDEDPRYRVPSRATTDVNGIRPSREIPQGHSSPLDPNSSSAVALPRRRLVPSSLNSRLIAPATPSALDTRRYLERATPERDTSSVVEKLAEDRGQRQLSLSQAAILNRTSSLTRRRESAIPGLSSPPTQSASYR
ncbi:hypothetical protein GQ53DRAFT_834191 [Thozetella sp. PMI_491]|nr:hypothetical protein GQ53DRAFT_834191 [Thozetella sp. PMI_491]